MFRCPIPPLFTLAFSIAGFFVCAGGWSTGQHVLFKRSVNAKAAEALDQFVSVAEKNQAECDDLLNATKALQEHFADVLAFGFSMKGTYMPGKKVEKLLEAHNITGFMTQLDALVPEEFHTFFGPPTEKEESAKPTEAELKSMECVERCIEEAEEKMIAKIDEMRKTLIAQRGTSGRRHKMMMSLNMSCSDEHENLDCIDHCDRESNSMYTQFLAAEGDNFVHTHCPNPDDQLDVLKLVESCRMSRASALASSFAFTHGKQFVVDFQEASDDKQRCHAVKGILVDKFAEWMSATCDQPEAAKRIERGTRAAAAYVLAQNTEGAVFRRCPEIYDLDF